MKKSRTVRLMSKKFQASTRSDYNYISAVDLHLAVCPDCGAYVFNVDKHVKFHENIRLGESDGS